MCIALITLKVDLTEADKVNNRESKHLSYAKNSMDKICTKVLNISCEVYVCVCIYVHYNLRIVQFKYNLNIYFKKATLRKEMVCHPVAVVILHVYKYEKKN